MIPDSMVKRDENFTIIICLNGYLFEGNGRDDKDDWINAKVLCNTFTDLVNTIQKYESLSRA